MPNFLSAQAMAKVTGVISIYHMMLGRRDAALQELVANYRLNQLMGEESGLIGRLISIAGRAIIIRYLKLFALNACESPQELAALWEWLKHLNGREPQALNPFDWLQTYSLFRFEPIANFLPEEEGLAAGLERPYFEEAGVRNGIADTRFQLVRMAAAARAHQLATGRLPGGAGDLSPLLPGGAPADAFTSTTLRLAPSGAGVVCYSVGPDLADDGGAIAYDPTNGAFSRGDIVAEVSVKREFPIPREGLRAASLPELWRQMPEGLPPDPFARVSTHGQLRVAHTTPLTIYSCGPDRDDTMPQIVRPQAQYDPTNGTTSRGDMWIQIPAR